MTKQLEESRSRRDRVVAAGGSGPRRAPTSRCCASLADDAKFVFITSKADVREGTGADPTVEVSERRAQVRALLALARRRGSDRRHATICARCAANLEALESRAAMPERRESSWMRWLALSAAIVAADLATKA